MIPRARVLLAGLSASIASLALSACAFPAQMSGMAVDHNRMVARTTDELTLLNIVRASHRFPLHFTAISEVNGNIRMGADAGLAIDLDPVVDPASVGLGTDVSTTPSFRAAVLATDRFQRGVQTPLPPELIAYYLDEGWRDGLLMALAIERVEVIDPAGEAAPAQIVNEAEADSDFARLLCTYELISAPSAASLPLATFSQLLDADILADPKRESSARREEISQFLALIGNEQVHLAGETLLLQGSSNIVQLRQRQTSRCAGVSPDPDLEGRSLRPRFRSTLGLIYFLGEYQRESAARGATSVYRVPNCANPCAPGAAESRPLIAIGTGGGEALVTTQFNGERYYISAREARNYGDGLPDTARSMQVLAFVQQLVNLQKSADQLPTSLTVSAVN